MLSMLYEIRNKRCTGEVIFFYLNLCLLRSSGVTVGNAGPWAEPCLADARLCRATRGLAAETPLKLNTGRIVEYCPEVESTCVSWSLMGSDGPVAPVGWW